MKIAIIIFAIIFLIVFVTAIMLLAVLAFTTENKEQQNTIE